MTKLEHTQRTLLLAVIGITTAVLLASPWLRAADSKPKYSIKEVMKVLHKGEDNIAKHVMKGQGTPAEIDQLVEYYAALPLNEPPRGDASEWKTKATELFKSAQALKAGEAGALEGYKKAVNCKACHENFKPQKKN